MSTEAHEPCAATHSAGEAASGDVDYSFESEGDWRDLTVMHKGGLFGGDYRMLFLADGTPGIKRFFLDSISEFFRRGMSCQPLVVGIGIWWRQGYLCASGARGGVPPAGRRLQS